MLNKAQLELIKRTISANSNTLPDTLIPFVVAVCKAVPPPTVKTVEQFDEWVKVLETPVGPQKPPTVPVRPIPVIEPTVVAGPTPPAPVEPITVMVTRDENQSISGTQTVTYTWRVPLNPDDIDFSRSLSEQYVEKAEEDDLDSGNAYDQETGDVDVDDVHDTDWAGDFESCMSDRTIAREMVTSRNFQNWCRNKGVPLPTMDQILDGRFAAALVRAREGQATQAAETLVTPGATVTLTPVEDTETGPDEDVDEGEEED